MLKPILRFAQDDIPSVLSALSALSTRDPATPRPDPLASPAAD